MDNNKEIFNEFSDKYKESIQDAISFSGLDVDFFTKVKIEILKEKIASIGDQAKLKILDVGCGVGETDYFLTREYPNLYGVDVSDESLVKAKEKNPTAHYQLYDGVTLPFEDNSFDMVFTINVMHHVPPQNWERFIEECKRVTRNGGSFLVFEHNPLNPLTQLVVKRCEFDKDAVLLFPSKLKKLMGNKSKTSFILFFPFQGKPWRSLEKIMKKIPFGAQYLVEYRK